ASFPMSASLGTYMFGGSPTLGLSSSNVFAGPAPSVTTNPGFDELALFNNLQASSLLTIFARVGSGLSGIATSLDVNAATGGIPYVDQQVSDIVDWNALVTHFSRGLYDPVITAAHPLNLFAGGRLSGNANFSLLINGTENDVVQFSSASQQVGE